MLQYFADTAHNPVSNQQSKHRRPEDRQAALRLLTRAIRETQGPLGFQVDASSWRSLQNPFDSRNRYSYGHEAEHIYSVPTESGRVLNQEIYVEPNLNEVLRRPRAQPQVPLSRKMGRRASEGSALSDRESYYYEPECYLSPETRGMVVGDSKMKAVSKSAYTPDNLGYPNSAGCRLSLDAGRRESSSSLTSSLADGSKDSLSSFDSASTLTGQETDDSIMTRFRKSFQQKEEFLRRPSNVVEPALIAREFYGRPKRLEKQMWPPNDPLRQDSPVRTHKPAHQNFQRVKNDIENERDFVQHQNGVPPQQRLFTGDVGPQREVKSPKTWPLVVSLDKIKEGAVAPAVLDNVEKMNGSMSAENSSLEEQR